MGSLSDMMPRLAEVFGPQVLRVLIAVVVLFVGSLVYLRAEQSIVDLA